LVSHGKVETDKKDSVRSIQRISQLVENDFIMISSYNIVYDILKYVCVCYGIYVYMS
jgi:hypothetical protein